MDISDRISIYREIEAARDKPLIVYATATRSGAAGRMAGDAVRELIDQLDAVPADMQSVDVLIHSSGGDPLSAWRLMAVLRERFDSISVLVPYMAFSAATIFALGADEIVMHPHAALGPIDPQITVRDPDGSTMDFGYEDVSAFLKFLAEDVRLTEQSYATEMVKKICETANPLVVGAAKRASSLSESVGERMLLLHMDGGEGTKEQVKTIARDLNRGFFAHGDAVSRTRARELNLKIAESDTALESLIWKAYDGLERYLKLREPFQPLHVFLSDAECAAQLVPAAAVAFPPEATPEVLNAFWQNWLNQALARAQRGAKEAEFSNVSAVMESVRCASEFRSTDTVYARREPTGGIQVAVTPRRGDWQRVVIQA